ncbi:MAG: 4-hydroxy-tetrahydrodipicolinate synthase [Candidatus Gastranaerophilales bacterium]|nr:4-hydroxy-tetrahydrodipicolinate synthase [Candidatus Gastranaerophilales bacterium]
MTKRFEIGSVITAMVTPFKEDLTIDYNALEKLVHHLINNGSDTILVAGTTGESPTLTHKEELDLLKAVKEISQGRVKIMMGAGSNCTQTAAEQSKRVAALGVDAILSVVPYYNKPSQEGMIKHFGDIAKSVNLPIMLYNIPGRTGVNMLPETIAAIAEENKTIFAVKQSNGDLDQVSEIVSLVPDGFDVFSGDDSLTLPMMALGAAGVVSVASHIIGSEIKEMIELFKAGKVQEAKDLHIKLYPVFKKIFMAPNPTPIKCALANRGILNDFVRSPLVSLNSKQREELLAITQ